MHTRQRGLRVARLSLVGVLLIGVLSVPAAGVVNDGSLPKLLSNHASQVLTLRYWAAHPGQGPSRVADALAAVDRSQSQGATSGGGNNNMGDLFNRDVFGLPQNEESVMACRTNLSYVLGATNDYRGLIDPQGNFTGWHFSDNGGASLTNEGLLPPVTLIRTPDREVPSGGDPVAFIADGDCATYAASLAYNPSNAFGDANGIAVYKSSPAILATCPTDYPNSSNPACWPVRRLIVESEPSHFLDKEWMYVGVQNGVRYVWVTYTDFALDQNAPAGFTGADIKAVRCDQNLVTCSTPIKISTVDQDVQFSDVTVGPDGRTYITWARIDGELEGRDQTFTFKIRTETAPGSAVFGPERVIYAETRAIPFGGFLHANDFRIATYPKSDVALVDGKPRIFITWDACKVRLFGSICEHPEIKYSFSDNDGTTWSAPVVISNGGDNYFPSISTDRAATRTQSVSFAWYTNVYDVDFNNRQDVQLLTLDAKLLQTKSSKRLTGSGNETEADPLLGGFFIGDYIEVFTHANRVWVHWNGNYRKVPLLGGFANEPNQPVIPVNQQDNYLSKTGPG